MKPKPAKSFLVLALTAAMLPLAAQAQLIISEVNPGGSGNTNYAADWFELRNNGALPLDITGWKMDDSSPTFATAVALRGVTSIAAGQAVVFLEGNATGTTDATIDSNFASTWFGGSVPAGLTLANYGGSGVGLSTSGDAVNIFDSGGTLVVGVTFGAATTGFTFDNAAGLSGSISRLSVAGVNNAFASFITAPTEVGSPGAVPEPSTFALAGLAATGLLVFRQRR